MQGNGKDYANRLALTLAATAEISPAMYGAGLQAVEQHSQELADWQNYSAKGRLLHSVIRKGSQTGMINISVDIHDGWHINAKKPTLPELVGSTVILADDKRNADWWLSPLSYPEPLIKSYSYAVDPIAVHEDKLEMTGQLVYRGSEANPLAPILEVISQACDDRTCLPPETTRLVVPY